MHNFLRACARNKVELNNYRQMKDETNVNRPLVGFRLPDCQVLRENKPLTPNLQTVSETSQELNTLHRCIIV
jgi:hypothetical protein